MAKRIFIDMDGVLAVFDKDASLETITMRGYFATRPTIQTVVDAVKKLTCCEDVECYILSSVFKDDFYTQDKNKWLDKHLPEIPLERRIYVPYGTRKADCIPSPQKSDVLLDDFSANLREWHGIGIKLLNGINGTKGSFTGYRVFASSPVDILYNSILGIIKVAA